MAKTTMNKYKVTVQKIDRATMHWVTHTIIEDMPCKHEPKDAEIIRYAKTQGNNLKGMRLRFKVECTTSKEYNITEEEVFGLFTKYIEGTPKAGLSFRTVKVYKTWALIDDPNDPDAVIEVEGEEIRKQTGKPVLRNIKRWFAANKPEINPYEVGYDFDHDELWCCKTSELMAFCEAKEAAEDAAEDAAEE